MLPGGQYFDCLSSCHHNRGILGSHPKQKMLTYSTLTGQATCEESISMIVYSQQPEVVEIIHQTSGV